MRQYRYNIQTGLTKIKTKTSLALSSAALGVAGLIIGIGMPLAAKAAGPCAVGATETYTTIQSAVNDVNCSVINVDPGTYTENVIIGRTLTLNGAQTGNDARIRSGTESILNGNITINASNVTVDGFTVNGPADQGSAAFVLQAGTGNTNETVQNNIINNPGRAASIQTSNTTFTQNVVNNSITAGDGFQANSIPVNHLTFSDNNFSGTALTNYNADITIIEGNSTVVVSGNNSNGDGTLIALFKTNGAQITGNTVVGDGASSAIYIGGGDSNVTVSGNTVSSAGTAVNVTNFFNQIGQNSNITITGNTLNSNSYGVKIQPASVSVTNSVTVSRNQITGNTVFGVFNDVSSGNNTLNATCNWWNAANGPGPVGPSLTGDRVSAPWLVSSNLNGSCIGGNIATNKDQCKNSGWMTMTRRDGSTFKNQGDCVSYTNNGR
jgi:hypothetical protein